MVGFLLPVAVKIWLNVALFEAKLLKEELEKKVPFPADGLIALNPAKHFQHDLPEGE